jgi:hypothetical protein
VILAGVGILDSWLLYRFFTVQLPLAKRLETLGAGPPTPS